MFNALKFGEWFSFYETGEVKSRGNYDTLSYRIGEYYGGIKFSVNLKYGEWIYYYKNGQIMAKGKYTIEGIKFTKIGKWDYWDEYGNSIAKLIIEKEFKENEIPLNLDKE